MPENNQPIESSRGLESEFIDSVLPALRSAIPDQTSSYLLNMSGWQSRVASIENDFAPHYDKEEFEDRPVLREMWRRDEAMLKAEIAIISSKTEEKTLEGKIHLAAACGTGREVLVGCEAGAHVIALDIAPKYLEITREKAERLGFGNQIQAVCHPLENFQVDGLANTLDLVSALGCGINHTEDWKRVLGLLAGQMKTGASLVATFYGPNSALVFRKGEGLGYTPGILQRRTATGILLGDDASDELPAVFVPASDVCRHLKSLGFEIAKLRGFLNYGAIFPFDPTPANIEQFESNIDVRDEMLRAAISQAPKEPRAILELTTSYDDLIAYDPARLDEFAYFGLVARKNA